MRLSDEFEINIYGYKSERIGSIRFGRGSRFEGARSSLSLNRIVLNGRLEAGLSYRTIDRDPGEPATEENYIASKSLVSIADLLSFLFSFSSAR